MNRISIWRAAKQNQHKTPNNTYEGLYVTLPAPALLTAETHTKKHTKTNNKANKTLSLLNSSDFDEDYTIIYDSRNILYSCRKCPNHALQILSNLIIKNITNKITS